MKVPMSMTLCTTVFGLTATLLIAPQASAAVFSVNTLVDKIDATDKKCSLREALKAANTNTLIADCKVAGSPGYDEIQLMAGTFPVVATLTVTDDVGFRSLGNNSIFDAAQSFNTINVAANIYFDLDGVQIKGGTGQAIFGGNGSYVAVDNSTIRDRNFAGLGQLGGIVVAQSATVALYKSTMAHNINATKGGGLMGGLGSSVEIYNSTLEGNHARQYGGGVHAEGYFFCYNSTISGNAADNQGGGVMIAAGDADLQFCTITQNQANQLNQGSGIKVVNSTSVVNVWASIVANQKNANTCSGPVGSQGNNVFGEVGTAAGCTIATRPTDLINIKANTLQLGALAFNGGVTRNHLPAPGSLASYRGPVGSCLTDDQRNFPRKNQCDVGAVEGIAP
jgi:CSLREA domain-containing protein